MAKQRRSKRSKRGSKKTEGSLREILSLYAKIVDLKKEVTDASNLSSQADERLTDLEIHLHLLTRLLTTLCIEHFGIRMSALRRLVKRIEKEAVRDSQIMELESLYNLPQAAHKKMSATPPKAKSDPWEQIS